MAERKMNVIERTSEYFSWIGELKKRYRATQIKAAVSVNTALLDFYWSLGKDISERYPGKKRNAHFFAELSADLKVAIPEANGFSVRNLQHIQRFYEFYSCAKQLVSRKVERTISYRQQLVADKTPNAYLQQVAEDNLPQVVADLIMQVPWGHHIVIMNKCGGDVEKALFYVRKTVENGWSRNVLAIEIDGDLYSRQGKAVTNFTLTMPEADSDLAQQLTKDPYIFEVQGLAEKYRETELTKAMCENIVRLLNSMGKGFAFVGREYVVEMNGEEYRMDLLFYLIPMHRYFVVEVKNTPFKPEYLGQLQGYVATCDMMLNTSLENPAIGLLVCRGKNAPLAKYLLNKIDMPIGISDYELMCKVPDDFKSQLPTIEEIETELANMEKEG
jgi:predicted nuclease of restriction endonuclease-like (RecB) superfamily